MGISSLGAKIMHKFSLFIFFLLAPIHAWAAVWSVDNDLADDPAADFTSIQEAIEAAGNGDVIIVHPGRYIENVYFMAKNIHLRSVDPASQLVAQETVIDGSRRSSTVRFFGSESASCILEGFTITNGRATNGGGIRGGTNRSTGATIRNNIIELNEAREHGGGIYACLGIIRNNLIRRNVAQSGGGLSNCNGLIEQNDIQRNEADEGAGLHLCLGTISKNNIERNEAATEGGGLVRCYNVVRDNVIHGNIAPDGGGLLICSGIVEGNVIRENIALRGAGLNNCNGTISGNTISKNRALEGGGIYGSRAFVENNQIQGNIALDYGGALAFCEGLDARNNVIEGNTAGIAGGGLYACSGEVAQNEIAANRSESGGALARFAGRIHANRFIDNSATTGGAILEVDGWILNNLFHGNRGQAGAAVAMVRGQLLNNTFVFHQALVLQDESTMEGLLYLSPGVAVRNNIFSISPLPALVVSAPAAQWSNGPERILIENNCFDQGGDALVIPSSGERWENSQALDNQFGNARDNFTSDPRLTAPDPGDPTAEAYQLASGSPCIDRATTHGLLFHPRHDLAGHGRLGGDRVDVGCLEFASGPDRDGDGLDDQSEEQIGTLARFEDTDGDGLIDSLERYRGANPLIAESATTRTLVSSTNDLQWAVMLAFQGDALKLEPGVYLGPVHSLGKTIKLLGTSPSSPTAVVDAAGIDRVLTLTGEETIAFRVERLVLTGGVDPEAAAVLGANVPLTLRHNIISSNTAALDGGVVVGVTGQIHSNRIEANQGSAILDSRGEITWNEILRNTSNEGAGLAHCVADIAHNLIEGNTALENGGGLSNCRGEIFDNQIVSNQARDGGGFYQCLGTIRYNTIDSNIASDSGGGLSRCGALIEHNQITNNHTEGFGGGIHLNTGVIKNNVIASNNARIDGGGLSACDDVIQDNEISENTAFSGAGLASCLEEVRGNRIVSNHATRDGGGLAACAGKIIDNEITENSARRGAGLFNCSGEIVENLIELNRAESDGGGIQGGEATIQSNRIRLNTAFSGGGISQADGLIQNNFIEANEAEHLGGGVYLCDGIVFGNLIQVNVAAYGGGIEGCAGSILNNTVVGNRAMNSQGGGGLQNAAARIINNIFFANSPYAMASSAEYLEPELIARNSFGDNPQGIYLLSYSGETYADKPALESAISEAAANFDDSAGMRNPYGLDGVIETTDDNDYRLDPDSRLIDSGFHVPNPPQHDLTGGWRIADGDRSGYPQIDLGAFEYNPPNASGVWRQYQ